MSQAKSHLKIPLSTLFGIAKMNQFPNGLFGDVKISLEFEDDPNIIAKLFKKCQVRTRFTGNKFGDPNQTAGAKYFDLGDKNNPRRAEPL